MPNKVLTAHLEEINLYKQQQQQLKYQILFKKNSRISDWEILELD